MDSTVDALFAQNYMHSEQAIVGALLKGAPAIAATIRAIPPTEQIQEFNLNVHTERDMCPRCAGAVNYLLGLMDEGAGVIGAALRDHHVDSGAEAQPTVRGNVWSDYYFRPRAQAAVQGAKEVYIHAKVSPKPPREKNKDPSNEGIGT
jgi:hypothetical protein